MILELKNINKTYINSNNVQREVLKNLSLSVQKGESITIVGPSGSGKSTLLNIVGIIDSADSGELIIESNDVSKFSKNQLAEIRNKKIGFIFQSHHLLPQLNLLENVLLPLIPEKNKEIKAKARVRALQLLEKTGLSDKKHQYPGQLSGGECQRVAVVRALINKPTLILADEPTGSLDEKSAENIGNLLTQINTEENVALIVVTHSQDLAEKIGTGYSLENGNLVKK